MVTERIALVRVVEALQVGDVDLAYAAALGALEGGPIADPRASTRCPVPDCLYSGWPGELHKHLAVQHGRLPARRSSRLVRAIPGGGRS